MRVIVGQLAAVWVAGMIVAGSAGWLFVVAAFLSAPVLTVPALLAMFGLVYLIGCLTPGASALSEKAVRRLLWALLITVAGTVGAILIPGVLDALHAGRLGAAAVLPLGLPFLLVAGMLVRNLPVRVAAAALAVTLVCLGIWLPEGGHYLAAFWHYTFR
ncbi:hypothetical protein [Amycolatopsis sp. GM8]|uniref:hypothetical protein n=1 Tax=Amycolatopsis sp. GM8 TaxID=2896530 RepID=UPI001F271A28|nr:hypothetical protein [Amycolatopsis sp. GM8]